MNILRLSTLSLAVAIAVLALAYANPSFAGKKCDDDSTHPSCKDEGGGGSDTNVPLAVAVVEHRDYVPDENSGPPFQPDCEAQASSIKNLWAYFPRHDICATLITSSGYLIADDIVIRVKIEKKKAGALPKVISVQVIGQDMDGAEGLIHQSDVITNIESVESNGGGSFVIHVHADDVQLWKCDGHLLKGQTTCTEDAGTFAIQDMVYTPDP